MRIPETLTINTPRQTNPYFMALKKGEKPVKKGLIRKKMLTFHP
jgi:hypothetical protein